MGMCISKLKGAARGRRGSPGTTAVGWPKKTGLKPTLLNLPPEIRNKIYHLVLIPDPDDDNNGAVVSLAQPALTRVSKQIRGETLTIFYGENHFALAMPFGTGRDWYAPPVNRVTRIALELEQPEEERDPENHPATCEDPVGWAQFLYTLDVLIRGGPASAGGPLGPVRLVQSLTAIYPHPFAVGSHGGLCHFTVGFTGLAPGAGGAAVRAHMAPCRVAGARGGRRALEAELARLLLACVGAAPGAADERPAWRRGLANLAAGASGLLALCPQLGDYVYLRVGEGAADERYGEDVHQLAVSEPVPEAWA